MCYIDIMKPPIAMKKISGSQNHSVKQLINRLLLIVSVTMFLIILVLSIMLIYINRQYEGALLCANTAAEFNKEFKSSLDLEMYNHVIQPRSDTSADSLPMDELDAAEDVIRRLESTTTLPDNRWRAQSMLDMCRNLRMYMLEIAATPNYDDRMELLERNIRGETGLTALIENYMHDFLDDEVKELARLRSVLSRQSIYLILTAVFILALLAVIIVLYSLRIGRRITAPIQMLSSKAEGFGSDGFSRTPIDTDIMELQILDRNFDEMANRINMLMETQRENQQSLHRAELELLQAQINPHFLYNTLDSIAILADSERYEDVVTMVTSLSTFFRNSLNNGQDIISLGAELAQATSYLDIQKIRYSDILDYSIAVPEDMLDITVPKLILQPLIENALYHGIKNRRGRGMITVTGCRDGEDILLMVKDNGAGIPPDQLKELQAGIYLPHHHGLGLKNVYQRIHLYCGEGYGFHFESAQDIGTTVTVRLPGSGVTGYQKEAL